MNLLSTIFFVFFDQDKLDRKLLSNLMLEQSLVFLMFLSLNSEVFSQSRLWQYGLWSFQTGGTKFERFLPKNQHTQRKFLKLLRLPISPILKIQTFPLGMLILRQKSF